ncbi:MAG: DUF5989 family protein [Elusimicrobiota bacterium]
MLKKMLRKFSVLGELLSFFWENKMWWIIPMVLVLVLIGLLLIFGQATGIAPFVYTLF